MRVVAFALIATMVSELAQAETPSTADLIANATVVPSPSALPSMPSTEWCRTVDAALANPRIEQPRREEYIATGQAHHCPNQMFLKPRKIVAAPRPPVSPEQWCSEAFRALGNPYLDQYLKAATLEKARNRGCLR